jgi:hypothetical protein
MKVPELLDRLQREGYADDQYWVGNDSTWNQRNDCICLSFRAPEWVIFYTERGTTRPMDRFDSEDAAADGLYRALQSSGPRRRCIASVRDHKRAVLLVAALLKADIESTSDSFFDGRGSTGLQYRVFVRGVDFGRARDVRDQLDSGWIPRAWHGEG